MKLSCKPAASINLLLRLMVTALAASITTHEAEALPPSDYLTEFVLVDSNTNEDIAVLRNGDIISYAHVGRYLNIRADVSGDGSSLGSVRFDFQGDPDYRIESAPPFALAGDNGGDYSRLTGLTKGPQTLCATPYTEANASGEAGTTLCIDFTIQSPALFEITNLMLMNADTDEELFPIENGASYFFGADLPTRNLNVCVSYTGSLESVSFAVSGLSPNPLTVESNAPYCLGGDIDRTGDILAFEPFSSIGTFHISAQGYTEDSSSGFTLPKSTIRFSLLEQDTQSPTPSPKKCFVTNFELRSAVQQYYNGGGTPDLEVSKKYGFPIGAWCVKDVTDFSHVLNRESFNDDISGWDVSSATNMYHMFWGAHSFNQPLDGWDVSKVTNMGRMFERARNFNQSLDRWNVSQVTNMNNMFYYADSFNQPLDGWDVSSATDMKWMFAFASSFNQPLDGWDVSEARDMYAMFFSAVSFNQPLDGWDVSKVTNMGYMFYNLPSFNQPLDIWDVSCVTIMVSMFHQTDNFNQPLDGWDVSKVTDMGYMFFFATSFNQPLDGWDVSQVTNMVFMFRNATSFNQPLDQWDVSRVRRMSYMFREATSFNQPLDGWDVSQVTHMDSMFYNATSFNQPLNGWDVSRVTTMVSMFHHTDNFNQPLDGWDVSQVTTMHFMFENAKRFNQNLCVWGPMLNTKTIVARMFLSATACPSQDSPSFASNPPGPFCYECS